MVPIQVKLKVISYQLCSIFVMFIPSRSPSWSSLYHTVKNRYLSHILASGNCSLTFQKMKTRFVSYNKESDHWTSISWTKSKSSQLISAASLSHSIQKTPRQRSLPVFQTMDHIAIHQEEELYQPQQLECEWKIHWVSMQDLVISDMEIGHIQMFVVFPDRDEYFWHLENQGGTRTKWAPIQVPSWWLLTSGLLITCPLKRKPFRTKLQPLMGEQVNGTIEERGLSSFW